MMGGDKKRSAVDAILGPDPKDVKEEEGGGEESLHACMQEFIDAIHAKDTKAAVEAFKACSAEQEGSEEEG